eukprot:COSAG04_NODE_3384_length_2869_cov_1.450181_4_plen_305_part_00
MRWTTSGRSGKPTISLGSGLHSSKSASNIVADRAAAEGQLHTMRAEEEQQKAHLSEMLQVLSGEVRAARAEVEELRAGEGGSADGRRSQPQQQDALANAVGQWADATDMDLHRTGSPPTAVVTPASPTSQLEALVDTGGSGSSVGSGVGPIEQLQRDSEILKQQLVAALSDNQDKKARLAQEKEQRRELRAELQRARESRASDATDEAGGGGGGLDEERVTARLQATTAALEQAVGACKTADAAAGAMKERLATMAQERDSALREVAEIQRQLHSAQVRWPDAYSICGVARLANPGSIAIPGAG